jgi:hypothetical protein
MKLSKFFNLLLMGLLCGVAAVGCKSSPPPVTKFDSSGSNTGGKSGDIGEGGKLGPGAGGVGPGGGEAATFNPDDFIRIARPWQRKRFTSHSTAPRSSPRTNRRSTPWHPL